MQQVSRPGLAPIRARSVEDAGRFVSTGPGQDDLVAQFLNYVFETAVLTGISDIHIEMDDIDGMEVRMRRSGTLELLPETLTADQARAAKTKLCAKCKLDDQERLIPQDGRMMVFFGGRRVDIRVAITPTVAGYKIVCRLLDSNNANAFIDTLEMPFMVKQTMKRLVSNPEGMVLMSGPTGSGKTTTLYALLQYLKSPERHILTVENPVEYAVKTFTQIDVDGHMTWSRAMRAALRLDPDVIMVGEIRDQESAVIAQQAGTSGHMVLSTVHANSAAEVLPRVLSFGLKGFQVASVLSAMIAQRLVKKLHPDSAVEWDRPNDVEREWLVKRNMFDVNLRVPRVVEGGFAGRLPLVEMIEITPAIRSLIEGGNEDPATLLPKIVELAAEQEQFETLAQAGVRSVLEGKTTLEEVMGAVSDVAYIPKKRRWEQILVHEGLLKVSDLEMLRQEIFEMRLQGKVLSLKHHMVNRGVCSLEQVIVAMGMADYHAPE